MTEQKQYRTTRERGEALKGRVRDAVDLLGHGNYLWGKERFVRAAMNAGERRKMRLWKDQSNPMFEIGLKSLSYFLGDIVNMHSHTTGSNVSWVLDLWEAALDDLYRDKEFVAAKREKTPDPSDEQIEGVQPFKEERSLAMRVLDAFTDRNAAAMLDLALEIERLELR